MSNKSKKQGGQLNREVKTLTLRVSWLEKEIARLTVNQATFGQAMIQYSSIIGRLVAGHTVLEQNGVISNEQISAVDDKAADAFCKAADQSASERLRNRPKPTGTVESNSGNGGSELSGESLLRQYPSSDGIVEPSNADAVNAGIR